MSTPRCRESDGSSPELGIDLALGAERSFEVSGFGLRPGPGQLVEVIVFDGRTGVGEAEALRQEREDGLVEALPASRGYPVEPAPKSGADRVNGEPIVYRGCLIGRCADPLVTPIRRGKTTLPKWITRRCDGEPRLNSVHRARYRIRFPSDRTGSASWSGPGEGTAMSVTCQSDLDESVGFMSHSANGETDARVHPGFEVTPRSRIRTLV
jgi:hypothetical protein